MAYVKTIDKMKKTSIRLPKGMNEAIHSIVDQQIDVVFTGSLALYLQGITDNAPASIDVMVPEHHQPMLAEAAAAARMKLVESYAARAYDSPVEESKVWLEYMQESWDLSSGTTFTYRVRVDDASPDGSDYTFSAEFHTTEYWGDDEFQYESSFDRSVRDSVTMRVEGFRVRFIPAECNEYVKVRFNDRVLKVKKADAVLDARRILFEATGRAKYAEGFDRMYERCSRRYSDSAYAKTNRAFAELVESGSYMKQNLADDRTKYAASKKAAPTKTNTSDKRQNLADAKVKTEVKPTPFKVSDPRNFGKNVSYEDFKRSAGTSQPVAGKHGVSHQGVTKTQNWGAGNAYQRSSSLDDQQHSGVEFGPGFAHNDAEPAEGE